MAWFSSVGLYTPPGAQLNRAGIQGTAKAACDGCEEKHCAGFTERSSANRMLGQNRLCLEDVRR